MSELVMAYLEWSAYGLVILACIGAIFSLRGGRGKKKPLLYEVDGIRHTNLDVLKKQPEVVEMRKWVAGLGDKDG